MEKDTIVTKLVILGAAILKVILHFVVAYAMFWLVQKHRYDYAAGFAVLILYTLIDAVRDIK